ncbi:MAG: OsmC family protein [Alphaproteobacteria bacterium]|nr:OsmC family protein [Alphaproteobacteria bacterium]
MAERGKLDIRTDWLEPVTLRLTGKCEGYALSRIRVRSHVVTIDEPPERGGTDLGPAPTETMVAALIGATNVILHRLARRDAATIDALDVAVDAVLDRRGVWLAEAIAVPWPEIRSRVRIATPADDSRLAIWAEDLPRYSPLHATLRAAGTRLTEIWERTTIPT